MKENMGQKGDPLGIMQETTQMEYTQTKICPRKWGT